MIVSRMISSLYFLLPSHAFFFMVMHISAYSIRSLSSPFPTISRHFVIRALVGEDSLDFCYLLIALAARESLFWIMYVMVSLILSMSSSYCSVAYPLAHNSFHYVQFDVALSHSVVTSNVDLVDDRYVYDDIWPVCYDVVNSGLRYPVWAFPRPSPP